MLVKLVTNPIEVVNRLEELGWTSEQLMEIVGAMVAARNSTTENDPSSAPGWMAWKEGTRRLRELALPMGWERDETNQIPSVVNHELGIKIAVCNTDDGTAIDSRTPQNRSKKGPATDRLVSENTGWLFEPSETPLRVFPEPQVKRQPGVIAAYYLCVYHEGELVRAELSCPVNAEAGYFTDFVERIFLLTPSDDDPIKVERPADDDGGEFDIPVTRK